MRKNAKKKRSITPSHRIIWRARPLTKSITEAARKIGSPSSMTTSSAMSGVIMPGMPMTTRILNAFEPKILPIASSVSPFFKACMETKSSGSDVPIAIAAIEISPSGI